MEVSEAIASRRSIRKYQRRAVEPARLLALVEAARLAPSGSNTQPWNLIVVRNDLERKMISEVCEQEWMFEAPALIVGAADMRARVKGDQPIAVSESSPEMDLKRIIRDTAIALQGVARVAPTARATVLTSASPDDENSFDEPAKVAPQETVLQPVAPQFRHTFPAHSVSILRLRPE